MPTHMQVRFVSKRFLLGKMYAPLAERLRENCHKFEVGESPFPSVPTRIFFPSCSQVLHWFEGFLWGLYGKSPRNGVYAFASRTERTFLNLCLEADTKGKLKRLNPPILEYNTCYSWNAYTE